MIENISSISNLDSILELKELDAILIGPYDLSSSLGKPGNFKNKNFKLALQKIINKCEKFKKPAGIHIVEPSEKLLKKELKKVINFYLLELTQCY